MNDSVVVNAGNNTASTTLSGVIDGIGGLTTSCGSTPTTLYVALTGANRFGGGVRLQSGLLRLGNNFALGTGTLSITDGTLASDGATARTLTNSVEIYGNFTVGQTSGGTGNLTLAGPVYLGSATRTLTVNNSGPDIISGMISGSAGVGLTKAGTGVLSLSGSNTYGGDTTITSGPLRLGAADVLPNGSGKGNLSATGILDLNGNSEAINGLSGAGIVDGSSGTPTLTVGDNNATSSFSGVIKNSSGSLALSKVGTGKLTLSGVHSYTGPTTISGGALRLVASAAATSLISNTPAIIVSAGATFDVSQIASGFVLGGGQCLSGSGTVTGNVTLASAALLAPGGSNQVGALTFNNALTLRGTTIMEIDQANGTNDAVKGISSLTYGGTLTVNNLGGTFTGGETYKLFTATTYNPGDFAATDLPLLGGNLEWAWNPANGTLSVVSTGVATTPTIISHAASGTNLTLSWPGSHLGWYAQSNSVNVANASYWHDIAGSETGTNLSLPIDPALPEVFYRLRKP